MHELGGRWHRAYFSRTQLNRVHSSYCVPVDGVTRNHSWVYNKYALKYTIIICRTRRFVKNARPVGWFSSAQRIMVIYYRCDDRTGIISEWKEICPRNLPTRCDQRTLWTHFPPQFFKCFSNRRYALGEIRVQPTWYSIDRITLQMFDEMSTYISLSSTRELLSTRLFLFLFINWFFSYYRTLIVSILVSTTNY